MTRHRIASALVLAACAAPLLAACRSSPGGPAPSRIEDFDGPTPAAAEGKPPAGFVFARTGAGAEGRWTVRRDPGAPSAPNVLLQEDADPTSDRYPTAVLESPSAKDVAASVRCIALSGDVDRAAGLVVRWLDERNYYVARANALEGNVRFYVVEAGVRRQLATADLPVTAGEWHLLELRAVGDRFAVSWDGNHVLEHRDATFSAPGRVGLWTKADSRTGFDDLTVTVLDPPAPTR